MCCLFLGIHFIQVTWSVGEGVAMLVPCDVFCSCEFLLSLLIKVILISVASLFEMEALIFFQYYKVIFSFDLSLVFLPYALIFIASRLPDISIGRTKKEQIKGLHTLSFPLKMTSNFCILLILLVWDIPCYSGWSQGFLLPHRVERWDFRQALPCLACLILDSAFAGLL